jgi:hypothetical protein
MRTIRRRPRWTGHALGLTHDERQTTGNNYVMRQKIWRSLVRFWAAEHGLSLFLILLVVVVFVLPLLAPMRPLARLAADLIFSLLLLSGVASVSERRWPLVTVAAVAGMALLVRWASWLEPAADLAEWQAGSKLVTFGLFSVMVLAQVFRQGEITLHRVQGATAVYLLLGMTWASAYELVALHQPAAFSGATGGGEPASQPWLYFSFVTLTTMGYGDITPVHPLARSLALLEALVGQLYPAILLARLVSLEVQSKTRG